MSFREKLSAILVTAVSLCALFLAFAQARLYRADQTATLGDFQTSLSTLLRLRVQDSLEVLTTQLRAVLAHEQHPLRSLKAGLDGYRGGTWWENGQRRESDEGAFRSPPQLEGDWGLFPDGDGSTSFILAVRGGDRVLSVALSRSWLDNFSAPGAWLSTGLILQGKVLSLKGQSLADSQGLANLAHSVHPRTEWIETGHGKSLVTVVPLSAKPTAALFLATPATKIESFLRDSYLRTVLVTLLFILAGILVAIWLAKHLTKPLSELQSATSGIGRGDFQVALPQSSKRKDELGDFARAFLRMGTELERLKGEIQHAERLSALGKFSASLAHEIKNPLTGIISSAELAKLQLQQVKSDPPPEVVELLGNIVEDAHRANRKINGLMKFARKDTAELAPLDLVSRVKRSLAMLEPTLMQSGVTLRTDLPDRAAYCLAHEDSLHEVLLNLAQNAVHAMKGRSEKILEVILKVKEREMVLEISDTGCGMSPETKSHLFEPFFTTKPLGEGTGLGLAAVHGTLVRHQARISVQSEVDRGTRFVIIFPLTDMRQEAA